MLSISSRYGKNTLIRKGQQNLAPICLEISKHFSAQAEPQAHIQEATSIKERLENARPFSEIPGPSKFEFIRGVFPGGFMHNKPFPEAVKVMEKKYGPLIRLPGLFGRKDMFITLNPDDFPIIFHNEGIWPYRRSFETVDYFRKIHRGDFFDGVEGIISTSGEKWAKWRSAVNPTLMQPKSVIMYLNSMLEVNDEFLTRIREIRDPVSFEVPADFNEEINCLTLETIASIALNTQLGLIRKNRDTTDAKTLVKSLRRFFQLSFEIEILPPFWKIIKTPKFHEMMNVLDNLLNISIKYINEALVKIEQEKQYRQNNPGVEDTREKSVLEKLSHIDKKFAVVMAIDMFLAGVDTTSSTLAGILLCIAKNPEKQDKLFEEMKNIMPNKNSWITKENMKNLPYLRACIKEGMRLYPILPGTMRMMPHDVVLSGYRVEKGAEIAAGSNLLLSNEKYVPQANTFLPERWLRSANSDISGSITQPFMFIPFGFGPRSCAGKRIVSMELEVILGRLVRNFKIDFNYSTENAFRSLFINVPNIPLKFKFEERPE